MSVIKNVIFDWSGTLVDDFKPVYEATNDVFKKYGKPGFTEGEFREKFFLPFTDFYKIYLPEATMVQLDHHYHESFKLLQENIPLLPHAQETLDYCKEQGIDLFLLSTIHNEHFKVQGERLGIKHYFKKACTQALDKRKVILELLAEFDLNPHETIFIGDMQHDIETAKHGGVRSGAVLTGYDSLEKLRAKEPDFIFKDLEGFLSHLQRHRIEPDYFPIATVGALIFDAEGRMLMLKTHKWSDLWGIPGGKIKTDESSEDALKREVKEETGLDVENVKFEMVQDCIGSKEFYRPAHFVLLNYSARARSHDVVLNDEAEEYQWVSPEELDQLDLNIPTQTLIKHVLGNK